MRNLTLTLLLFASLSASAQKLPNKQEKSVWAPANIKIDGKVDEWNNKFQAYNHATDIYYSIANNDKNLYIVFHANDQAVIFNKILTGGITLVFKYSNELRTLTYPFFPKKDPSAFKRVSPNVIYPSGTTPAVYQDSVSSVNNLRLTSEAKEILVTGFKNIDTLISIYNEYGFKVFGRFDAKGGFTCEIAVPINMLELNLEKLNYEVIINGGTNKYIPEKAVLTGGVRADGTPIPREVLDKAEDAMNVAKMARFATTSFSGEYTLAKAP